MKKILAICTLIFGLASAIQSQTGGLGAGFEIDCKSIFPREYYAIGSIGGNISAYLSNGIGFGLSVSIQKPLFSTFSLASLPYDGIESLCLAGIVGIGFDYQINRKRGFVYIGPAITTIYSENGKIGNQNSIYGLAVRNEIEIDTWRNSKITIPCTIGYGIYPEVMESNLPNMEIWITTSINFGI